MIATTILQEPRAALRLFRAVCFVSCFFLASTLSAQSTDPRIELGDSLRQAAGNTEGKLEAIEAYQEVLADSASVAALSGIGQAYHDLMLLGLGAAADNDVLAAAADSAESYLRRALDRDPGHGESLAGIAQVIFRSTDWLNRDPANYDEAASFAERLLDHDRALGHYLLSRIYWLKGEHALALEAVERSIEEDPDGYLPRLILGYLYFDQGRHDKGIPAQREAARLNPDDPTPLNLLGFSYIHIGLPELARPIFDDGVALAMTGYSVGGQLMIRLGNRDFEDAVAYTDSILQLMPEPEWAWARSGEALLFAGEERRATHAYEEALSRDSTSANIYTWKSTALPLAYLYLRQGKSAEAEPLIKRSYEHADALINRGQEPWNSYYQYAALDLMQGDRASALRWLRAAYLAGMPGRVFIELDPLLSGLHGDPEFEALVQKLSWREQEIRERIGG